MGVIEVPQVARSVLSFSGMTLVSRVLGYGRDAVMMIVFGAGGATDAFLVAFRLPNFLRRLFAEGAFAQAFVPVLAEYKEKNPADLKAFIDHICGVLLLVLFVVTVIGVLSAPLLIFVFAPGFTQDASQMELAGHMLRITFPYILFISLTSLAAGILNVFGRFALPALTPAVLNLAIIAAALWLAPLLEQPITALAWGVLLAGVLQLAIQLVALQGLGLLPKPTSGWRDRGVRRVLRLMSPAVFGASVVQINLLIDTIIASFLVAGSISWLYISDRFVELPVGLFGVALAVVLLPRLSRHYAAAHEARFRDTLAWGVTICWLLALPCLLGLILLAEPILITLVQYREFTATDTFFAGLSLIAYALGLPAFMFIKILGAGFFSRQNPSTPVKIALVAMFTNLSLNLFFVWLWSQQVLVGCTCGSGIGDKSVCVAKLWFIV